MSASSFQAAMVRLVLDRKFRARVNRVGERALSGELSQRERSRLVAAAAHRGLDITRMMYVSFRLSRLQAGAPYTFQLLGKRRRNAELSRYLELTPPTSFYYVDEGRALLAHLRGRLRSGALTMRYLADVIAYEAGLLAIKEARDRRANATVTIRLQHDIAAITGRLDAGKRQSSLRRQPALIIATLRDGRLALQAQSP